MPTLSQYRAVNPWAADYSDEDIIAYESAQTGKSPAYTAEFYGYSIPDSTTGKDLSAAWSNYKAGFQHIGAALGSETMAKWAAENEARSKLLNSTSDSVKTFADVHDLSDFGSFVKYGAIQTLPYVGEAVAAGLTGGGTAAARAVGQAGLRTFGRSAAEREAAELLARNSAMGGAEAARLAEESVAKGYARSAAAGVGSYPSSVGTLLSRQHQENGDYNLGTAAALGVPYAALNMVGLEGQMLRGLPRSAGSTALKRAGVGFAEGALPEAGAEMSQTFLERTGAGLKPFEGSGYEYIDSGILGGALGGVPGSFNAAVRGPAISKSQQADLLQQGFNTDSKFMQDYEYRQATEPDRRVAARMADANIINGAGIDQSYINESLGIGVPRTKQHYASAYNQLLDTPLTVQGFNGSPVVLRTVGEAYDYRNGVGKFAQQAPRTDAMGIPLSTYSPVEASQPVGDTQPSWSKFATPYQQPQGEQNAAPTQVAQGSNQGSGLVGTGSIGNTSVSPVVGRGGSGATGSLDGRSATAAPVGSPTNNGVPSVNGLPATQQVAQKTLPAATTQTGAQPTAALTTADKVERLKAQYGIKSKAKAVNGFVEDIGTQVANGVITIEEAEPFLKDMAAAKGNTKLRNEIGKAWADFRATKFSLKENVAGVNNLPEVQQKVFNYLREAFAANESDRVLDADGTTFRDAEIAEALGLERGSVKMALNGMAKHLEPLLKSRTKGKVEEADASKLGMSPAVQNQHGMVDSDLFGNAESGAEQNMGIISSVGGSQSDIGAGSKESVGQQASDINRQLDVQRNRGVDVPTVDEIRSTLREAEQTKGETERTDLDVEIEQRNIRDAAWKRKAHIEEMLAHPEAENAALDFDNKSGLDFHNDLTAEEQSDWISDYVEFLYEAEQQGLKSKAFNDELAKVQERYDNQLESDRYNFGTPRLGSSNTSGENVIDGEASRVDSEAPKAIEHVETDRSSSGETQTAGKIQPVTTEATGRSDTEATTGQDEQRSGVTNQQLADYIGEVVSGDLTHVEDVKAALTPENWKQAIAAFALAKRDYKTVMADVKGLNQLVKLIEGKEVGNTYEGDPQYKLGEAPKKPMQPSAVQAIVDRFVKNYPGTQQLRIEVAPDESWFKGGPKGILGAYYARSGKVIIVASMHSNAAEVEETLRHELLGHFGLDLLRPVDKQAVLDKIQQAAVINPKLREMYSAELVEAKQNPDIAANEVLANLAENYNGFLQPLLDAITKIVNKGLIAIGLRAKGYVTFAELRDQIRLAAYGLKNNYRQQTVPANDNALFRTGLAQAASTIYPGATRMNGLGKRLMEYVGDTFQTVENALLFGNSLAEKAINLIPGAKEYIDSARKRQVERVKQEQKIAEIYERFESLKGEKDKVNKLLENSTLSEKWAYDVTIDGNKYTADAELNKAFRELSPEAQQVVRDVFQYGIDQQKRFDEAINANLPPKERIKRNQMYGKPYAPFKRFGDHVVIGKSAEYRAAEAAEDHKLMTKLASDGNHYHVEFTNGNWDAINLRDKLAAANPNMQWDKKPFQTEDAKLDSFNYTVLKKLEQQISGDKTIAKGQQSALASIAQQMYLRQLNSLHANKSQMRRNKVAGYETDMMRSFVSQGKSEAALIAQLQTHAESEGSLQKIRSAARQGGNQDRKTRIANELMRRHLALMNYKETPIQDFVMKTNSVFFLLTSPAYYLTNMTQPFFVSLPYMLARHNASASSIFTSAYKEALGFTKLFSNNKLDLEHLKKFDKSGKESEALKVLLDENVLNIGMEMELGEVVDGSGNKFTKPVNRAISKLRMVVSNTETLNRLSTAVAAYRMEYAKALGENKSAEAAHAAGVSYAREVINKTHGDYSGYNAPSVMMQGAYGHLPVKAIMQFKKYSFIQFGLFAGALRQSFNGATKDERAAARAMLKWMMGTQAVIAGALGMPLVNLVALTLGAVFGDDAEDEEEYLRGVLGGGAFAQLVLHGAPAALGMDVSKRVGAANIVDPFGLTNGFGDWKDKALSMTMGPAAGLMNRAAQGAKYMGEGQYWKGIENFLPNGIANASKGVRFAENGITNSRGEVVMKPEDLSFIDEVAQAVGLPTTTITDRQWKSKVITDREHEFKQRAGDIKRDYVEAVKSGESTGEAVDAWLKLQAARVNMGYKRQPVRELRDAVKTNAKRERDVIDGVQFNKSNRGAVSRLSEL